MAKIESVPRQCRHEAQDPKSQENFPCLMAKLRDRGGGALHSEVELLLSGHVHARTGTIAACRRSLPGTSWQKFTLTAACTG